MKHGEPDIRLIRKVFDDKNKAIKWEQTVLRRINVEKRKDFLNAKNSTTSTIIISSNITSFKKGNVPWNKNLILSDYFDHDWCKKYSRKKTDSEIAKITFKTKKRFEDLNVREQYRKRTLEQFSNNEFKEYHKKRCISHSDKIWINDGIKNKRVTEENYLHNFLNWNRGRIMTIENKIKLIKGRKNGN